MQLCLRPLFSKHGFKADPVREKADLLCAQFGTAFRSEAVYRAADALRHERCPAVICIDPGRTALGEDFFLCRGIVLHRPVEIQMILGQIHIHHGVKLDSRHAAELQRVGRDLHYHMAAMLLRHPVKQPVQLQTFGGRVFRGNCFLPDPDPGRTDQADLCPAGRLQHMLQNRADTGFPTGAGNADHPHL